MDVVFTLPLPRSVWFTLAKKVNFKKINDPLGFSKQIFHLEKPLFNQIYTRV